MRHTAMRPGALGLRGQPRPALPATTDMKYRDPDHHRLAEPDEDLPLFRCADAVPAAPDGQEWEAQVVRLAHELYDVGGPLRPSQLRDAAEGLGLIPHHPNRWGVVWAKLRAAGWQRTPVEVVSTTATRNAARESVWRRA